MFTRLMTRQSAMFLALGLSFSAAAFAQTHVLKQTTHAQLSYAESESGPAKEDIQESKTEKGKRADDVDDAGKSEATGQSDKTNKGTAQASASQEPPRRAKPAPLDGVFPSTEYLGPTPLIGVPDADPVYPLTKALWSLSPTLKKTRIKVYGWINPGTSMPSALSHGTTDLRRGSSCLRWMRSSGSKDIELAPQCDNPKGLPLAFPSNCDPGAENHITVWPSFFRQS